MKKEENNPALKWIYARTKKFLPLIILLALISAAIAVCSVVLALITKNILDIATGDVDGSFLKSGIVLFIIIAFEIILNASYPLISTYVNGKLTVSIRDYMFSEICKKKYSEITGYHSGDLLNRMTSDTDVIVMSSVSIIPSVVSIITKIVCGIGALLYMNPILAVIILILGISVPGIGRIINKRFKKLHKEMQKTEGFTRQFLQECFENIVVIKTFISEQPFKKKLDNYMYDNFKVKMKRSLISSLASLCLFSFFTIGYYAIMVWGAGRISRGAITYGTLMAFLQLVSQLRAPLQNVSGIMPQYYSAIASAERIMEIENKTDELSSAENEKMDKLKKNFNSIEVNCVSFGYMNESILEECSFKATKGQIVAITGESGSGKSTLFKLILGLYEPNNGNITINGNTKLDTSLRGLFSYVPQGNMVLSGTIRDNITLCDSGVSIEQLEKAAKAAEIFEFIETCPSKFETVISERGSGLSEGQVQRISIARALLVDAPVLLLDEATSALDEETETRVLKNIRNMTDKTILFITHRNTSLAVCDRIIHIDNKKFTVFK